MSTRMAPPPREPGDSGYIGDGAGQGRDFTRMSAFGLVPAWPRDRGREPGTDLLEAP
jgi:hypothetical protein